MFLWISRILCFIPLNIIHPTFIKGRKNMPKGKAIISSNHLSNWDIALYLLNTSERVNIMAKKELFKNFFLNSSWFFGDGEKRIRMNKLSQSASFGLPEGMSAIEELFSLAFIPLK